tara:strand:- start:649 stop:837 length:189 start_codon:yes stop_codon:yes gene_type:complete
MSSYKITSNISSKASSDGLSKEVAISKNGNIICIEGYKCTDFNSVENIYLKYLHFSKKKENE